MSDGILEIKNLTAYYEIGLNPTRAVDNASLGIIRRGEIFGIAGESACGKTTLALAILRLLKPPGHIRGGEVIFDGANLLELAEEKIRLIRWKRISYVPQSSMNALNPVMRIRDQISDGIEAHESRHSRDELDDRIEKLLTDVGLSREIIRMYPHELSGGMKQRVAIAMATALDPEVLIADEPTTALDVIVQRGILQLLMEIRDRMHTILLITHDMAAQAEISDRVGIMYAGKIVEIGRTEDVFKDPLHPYTRLLIASIPKLKVRSEPTWIGGLPPDLRNPPEGCRFSPRCPRLIAGTCDTREPELSEVEPGRFVACHLQSD
jgi:peptide/nickel transport system ATP-binding protein